MLALATASLSFMAPPTALRNSPRAAVRMAEKVEMNPAVLAAYMALPGAQIKERRENAKEESDAKMLTLSRVRVFCSQ